MPEIEEIFFCFLQHFIKNKGLVLIFWGRGCIISEHPRCDGIIFLQSML